MARVVVVGGGVVGLSGAILLARDGHDVTVLERDPAPPCAPGDAWTAWERRGVNQFRQGHYLLPRFRSIVDAELPDVAAGLEAAGALRVNPLQGIPPEMSGGLREDDDRFQALTARRPIVEAVFAHAADATANCDVRRGVTVRALRTSGGRVDGVVLEDGDAIDADVVIDAGGRRSSMSDLIEQAGMVRPIEDRHDLGFVYYGRHFRSADGSIPPAFGPLLQHYDSLSVGTLPADNGTWAVVIVTSGSDRSARALKDVAVWDRVLGSYPLLAHWAQAEPLSDKVEVMAAIEDRYRHFVVDGAPVAPGVLPLGDAFACTNPSVGRGVSIGLMHALALRDFLRTTATDDAVALSSAWNDVTEATVGPYILDTLFFDSHRLAEIDAQIEGVPYQSDDPEWEQLQALFAHAGADPDLLRGVIDIMSLQARPVEVFARPGLAERLAAIDATAPREPFPGPSRAELVALLAT